MNMSKSNLNSTQPAFFRLDEVLKIFPVSKSAWWEGVRSGRYPRAFKLSERVNAWKREDIEELVQKVLDGGFSND